MKYKPKHSNFNEMQNEIAERLLSVHESIEDIKDAVAREIDEYVEAILKEHVEEAKVWTIPGNEDCPINVIFSAGQKPLATGQIGMFAQEVPLSKILDDFKWWDELSDFEPQATRNLAERVQAFADQLRKRADEIERENIEWQRKWDEEHSNEA